MSDPLLLFTKPPLFLFTEAKRLWEANANRDAHSLHLGVERFLVPLFRYRLGRPNYVLLLLLYFV